MKTELTKLLRLIVRYVHPMDIPMLMVQGAQVLACSSGLDEDHPIFLLLYAVRTADELASFDWERLARELQNLAWLHAKTCKRAVLSLRLLADRALLHRKLHLSKSASTLKLLGQCTLPLCPMPLELLGAAEEFEHSMCEADSSLHAGRRLLDQFKEQALQGASQKALCLLLNQAQACYVAYQQALEKARELASYVSWYLQEKNRATTHESTIHAA